MRAATACSRRQWHPGLRKILDEFCGGFHFQKKFRAKSRACGFIKLHRFLEFPFGGEGEPRLHFGSPFFKSAKTSAASRAVNLPVSKASMRRSDSAAQAASHILRSAPEMESQSTSINRARSVAGSPRISS